ncbi:hypothetical protein KPH14_004537 [Odynerus spinipes]|uniref:Timeless C-terminal domain-containing protein n=1 Tax=Odynerus spinipes TaxID=1348599 RepID=A0AAD9RLX1_9HYME|nr:hypothetical protein KPH14_004537 [Odynerus spinipes]
MVIFYLATQVSTILLLIEDDTPTQAVVQEDSSEESDEDEEDDGGLLIVEETDFKLSEFVQRFANIKIVKALALLLQQFDKNTNEVNHYTTKMLHRIAWECKMPAMIFQASIFRTFQRILDSKHPGHKELQKFAIFIIRRFIEVAQKNPKVYMELLFWKNTRDATQVVDGYSAETENKKISRSVWTEEEEDELRTLFMEHQTNNPPQDLVDWILERLINETRTRRGVIKKLKEMCLVVNSKGVRSEVQKRLPKEWSEEEIVQLKELWEQLREDEDPVGMIFNELRIKRPKPKIKEKLLELGMAKDPRELYKKRRGRSKQRKSSWETQAGSNSDEDRDSEEETAKSSGRNSVAGSKPTKKRTQSRSRRKRDREQFVYTDAQLSGLLKAVIDGNMTEALKWLKESLEDALEDRDEESSEGIPLVPLTDYSSTAMESATFQKLLRAMGITPPKGEQEAYWRIPANMLASTIRKRCDLIEDALQGKFIVEEPPPEKSTKSNKSDGSDDDGDVLENVKKYFTDKESEPSTSQESATLSNGKKSRKPRKRNVRTSETQAHQEETDSNFETIEENGRKSRRSRKMSVDSVDSETSHKSNDDKRATRKVSRGRRKTFLDSSESESEIERKEPGPDEAKRNRSRTPETDIPSSKRPRLLDSDEESESSQVQNTKSEIKPQSENEEDNPAHDKTSSRIIDSDEESLSEKKHNSKPARKIISDDEDD